MNETQRIHQQRQRLKKQYGKLYHAVSQMLLRHDPIHINFGSNSDEYEPEVGTILPKLTTCHSVRDVQCMVHQEFIRWFSHDDAGEQSQYHDIAREIWQEWQAYQQNTTASFID